MADVALYQTETFTDLHLETIHMGQAVSKSRETYVRDEEVPVFTTMSNNIPKDMHMSSTDVSPVTRTPENASANGYSNTDEQITHDLENKENGDSSSHAEIEQPTKRRYLFLDEEPLCAGETKYDATIQTNHSQAEDHKKSTEDADTACDIPIQGSIIWAEKKRQFSLMKQQSEDSFSSEMSSQSSRHSVSSYLHAIECDAEEVFDKLGFGFGHSMDIPERFWQSTTNTNIVVSSEVDMEDDEIFDCAGSSLASFESSWSDSSMGKLPSRFTSSLSRSSPLSSVSELNDIDDHSVIPSIVEPEDTEQEDTFDLMRHLRLNRNERMDKGFLEPVTEEQEVSSVGSGSARTQVNAQQDSFDSVGNASVGTKISRKWESEDSTSRTLRSGSIPELEENNHSFEGCDSKDKLIMDRNEALLNNNGNLGQDEPTIAKQSLTLPAQHKHLLKIGLPQDSFELEEIVTSEENLDRIGERRTVTENSRTNHLRRENSDESSGFEDDSADFHKRRSLENHSLSIDSLKHEKSLEHSNVSENEKERPEKDQTTYLLVPCQISTPNNEAETRRSAFAKRETWSTTRQKHVVFEDETYQRSWSFGDLPTASRKLEVKSRSLDDSYLPLSSRTPSNAVTDSSIQNAKERGDTCTADTSPGLSDTRKRTSSENKAISNIKLFISSLLSIRRKFKNPIRPKSDSLRSTSKEVDNTERQPTGRQPTERHDTMVVCTSLGQTVTRSSPSSSSQTVESCRQELKSFEENLQKYRATFIAMDVISTSQDKYYTRKLQARFAWDLLFIRRLCSQIKDELDVMQSNLLNRAPLHNAPLPRGVQHQMESLLRLQSGLRENLLTLAKNSPDFTWRIKPVQTAYTSFDMTYSIKDVENKIRDSVMQELGSVFQLQINELRAEMKGKDALINDLVKTVQQYEESKHQNT